MNQKQLHYKELENYPTIASNSYRCGVYLGRSEVRSVMSRRVLLGFQAVMSQELLMRGSLFPLVFFKPGSKHSLLVKEQYLCTFLDVIIAVNMFHNASPLCSGYIPHPSEPKYTIFPALSQYTSTPESVQITSFLPSALMFSSIMHNPPTSPIGP